MALFSKDVWTSQDVGFSTYGFSFYVLLLLFAFVKQTFVWVDRFRLGFKGCRV